MGEDAALPREVRSKHWIIAVAIVAAMALAWAAPDDWQAGSGELEVRYLGEVVLALPVDIGSDTPISAEGTLRRIAVEVSAPSGLGFDGPIEIEIRVFDAVTGATVDLALADLEVNIIGADGTKELLPVFASDDADALASRRPVDGAAIVLGLMGLAIVLWVTEVVPLFVTSLIIPVVVAMTEVGLASEALAPFFDPIIVLFFAGFLMAQAMRSCGLDRVIALAIVDIAGGGAVRLYVALVGLAAFLSMWMSNTAAVAVLIPIAMTVTEPLNSPSYRRVVVLGIAYAATIGGVGSAIGTPANPLAIEFIEQLTGRQITFVEWLAFGVPFLVVFLPMMAVYLWLSGGVDASEERFEMAAALAREQRKAAGRFTRPQLEVLAVFGVVMGLWLTQSWHDLNTGIVALAGAIVLFVLNRLEPADLSQISWPTLLTFGGSLTLGRFMVATGTSDWLVTRLAGLGNGPDLLAIAIVAFAALGLTTVASNTAAAATLIPLAVPLAGIIGVEPVLLVVVVAVASSVDFALVIGTPPTMIAYSTELFTVRDILKKGAPLDILGVAVLVVVVVPIWQLMGLV